MWALPGKNRVGHPPLTSVKEMNKKATQRGTLDYVSSDGILVARWKDNSVVTILSSDVGVEPMGTVERYDRAAKKKVPIPCPSVIQMYNNRMGGIDKSDMLTHLYRTPFKAKRYYMRLFAYLLDLIICNTWILYKRDCLALQENPPQAAQGLPSGYLQLAQKLQVVNLQNNQEFSWHQRFCFAKKGPMGSCAKY
ncbi:piggyBac transposable element-derived protein 3-like [Macrobrachium nipponense]|uniref:piggyBac transposable element-derived protein 3-like n=1 Tax=Macrobrachium nipponense TaxID=159736 RepID=UPI0030C87A38